MKTFYLEFEVTPINANEHYRLAKGAKAICCIQCDNPQIAYNKAKFYVSKNDWKVEKVECLPVEVTEENFSERDLGLKQYLLAQEKGIAITYIAWARDGKTTAGPFAVRSSYKFPLSAFLEKQKQLAYKGRCLHYENDHRCKEIIRAHSIQKNGALSVIADKGHVYKPSFNIGSLEKNNGQLTYEKTGINKVSTFLGFCGKHDNELFEPIDNYPLVPTDQQVLLYAYRSLCRELFVKENALELIESQLEIGIDQYAVNDLFLGMKQGTAFGLKNLKKHKEIYDNSLREGSFSDTRYVLFVSRQKPTVAFSGSFYPDFDFIGRPLQNLGDHTSDLKLITICSAPMDCGWGYLFAWHVTSSNVCVDYMQSLATMIYENNMPGDLLFRLAIKICENLAISPKWWESLSENQKEQIASTLSLMASSFSETEPFYLMKGLEGITHWEFKVVSNMD